MIEIQFADPLFFTDPMGKQLKHTLCKTPNFYVALSRSYLFTSYYLDNKLSPSMKENIQKSKMKTKLATLLYKATPWAKCLEKN